MAKIYDFTARRIDGTEEPLALYRDKVLLIVNTASRCGFTPQYEGLERLQKTYGPRGLAVLGFPCNQFGGQEPADDAAIASFCKLTYDVTFPMFAKVAVNGEDADPLFQYLKAERPGLLGLQAVKWNFTKFLIDRSGAVLERFAPTTKPESLVQAIERAL